MRSSSYLIMIVLISKLNINPLVRTTLLVLVFSLQLHAFFKNNPGCKILIKFRYIPKYKKLISQYNAKYPCMMFYLDTQETSFHNFIGTYFATSYIFIKDESFIIISTKNPGICIQIPFKSIICQDTYCHHFDDGVRYNYFFDLFFKANDNVERIVFCTLPYNHKLCKKYPDLLCDDQLFNFVCENFIDSDEVFNS